VKQAQAGDILAGRYRLEEHLGEGGSGTVFRARDAERGTVCALKALHRPGEGAESLNRFKREFRAASRLRHPHCLPVYELDHDEGRWFYTMEYVAGGRLRPEEWCRWQDLVPLALQMLDGLDHIHSKQIVHRDVKPENILLERPRGGPAVVKLADFGISKVSDADQVPLGTVFGSLAYLAPEQLEGAQVDPRTDLYALGMVLYEVLAGQNPFRQLLLGAGGRETRFRRDLAALRASAVIPPLAEATPGVPAALGSFVMGLLEGLPEDRYPTAALAHDELVAWWSRQEGVAPLPQAPSLARAAHLATARLVGRARELASIEQFVEEALHGNGRASPLVCFVEGGAGLGKSRLVGEIARRARARGVRIEAGTWHAEAGGRWPLAWMLRLAEAGDGAPAPGPNGNDITLRASENEVLDRRHDEAFGASGGPQWRVYRRIADALMRGSNTQPLLVVLEDAHWADEPSVAVLASLLRSLAQARQGGARFRIALLFTHRPSPSPELAALEEAARGAGSVELALDGLDDEQAVELVASMLMCPIDGSLRAFVDRLLDGGRANPLYIAQTLHLLLSTGALVRRAAAWALEESALTGARLPETVTAAIGDRAARLSAETKRLLATTAILGREFELEVAQRAARMDSGMALDCLDEAVRAGFVLEGSHVGDVFLFAHDRFRDAIREGLSAVDQIDLHQRAAASIAEVHGDAPEHAGRLAYHHGEAGAPEAAYRHSVRAADHETAAYMFAQASEHYARALRFAAAARIAPSPALTERHAEACLQSGRYQEAFDGFTSLLATVERQPLARAEILRKCAEIEFRRGNTARAEIMLEQVLHALDVPTPPAGKDVTPGLLPTLALFARLPPLGPFPPRVQGEEAHRNLVFVRAGLGLGEVLYFRDWGRAVYYGSAALRAAQTLGSCIELAAVTASAALVASASGARGLARALHERAQSYLEGKSPIDRAYLYLLHAISAACHGETQEALADLRVGEELLNKTHEPLRLREVQVLRADLLSCLGDFDAADAAVDKALRLAAELEDDRGRGWGLYLKGRLASRRGRRDEARALLETAAAHAERSGDLTYRLNCEASRAFDLLLAGAIDEAVALASVASREYARRRLMDPVQPADGVFLAAAGMMLARDGRLPPELRRQVRRVRLVRWYRARCMSLTRPMFWAGAGTVDVARGKLGRGLALFEKAAHAAEAGQLLGVLLDVYALAARALPDPHRARYARLHAELLERLVPTPVLSSSAA
jgi:tetratricopeptide (TPR) repeat protein